MKTHIKRDHGSVLIVVLVSTVIIGVTLASYLNLVSNQNLSIMRSMAWNEAVAVAEAGIEEAMAHLNRNRTNRIQDGWLLVGTEVVLERTLGRQKYIVYIDAYADMPNITAEGWVRHPQTQEMLPKPRTIKVTTTNDAIFAKGLVAKGKIDLAGNGILSDSFDSTDSTKSTGGKYDAAKRGDNGDIATNSSVVDSLSVWNAEVFGKTSTGPGGNVEISKGTVGSLAYHAAGKTGIQEGWAPDDMNVFFPDVNHPGGGFYSVTSLSASFLPGYELVDGVSTYFDYIVSPGYYCITPGLDLKNKKMYIKGPTTLLVEGGDLSISGQGGITLDPAANLQLYMNGPSAFFGGNSVANLTGKASNFSYWGMPQNTQLTLQGNAEFLGSVYAPQAAAKFGGGGSSGQDFMGASVTASATLAGHFKFHYDESLGAFGPRRGYAIVSWNEVAPTSL